MKTANDTYANYIGTENYYRYASSSYVYTDGVRALAMDCQAYWLIDLVISHQTKRSVSIEVFQVWQLKRTRNDSFKMLATDGNHKAIASQVIPYSDFPYDVATVWLVGDVLMLPSEY